MYTARSMPLTCPQPPPLLPALYHNQALISRHLDTSRQVLHVCCRAARHSLHHHCCASAVPAGPLPSTDHSTSRQPTTPHLVPLPFTSPQTPLLHAPLLPLLLPCSSKLHHCITSCISSATPKQSTSQGSGGSHCQKPRQTRQVLATASWASSHHEACCTERGATRTPAQAHQLASIAAGGASMQQVAASMLQDLHAFIAATWMMQQLAPVGPPGGLACSITAPRDK
jgi:hypothetical protein